MNLQLNEKLWHINSYVIQRGKLLAELLFIICVIHGLLEDAIPRIKVIDVNPNAKDTHENSAQPNKKAKKEKVSVVVVANAIVQPGTENLKQMLSN